MIKSGTNSSHIYLGSFIILCIPYRESSCLNVMHVGNTFVQLSQSTSLIVSEEMKCWRHWSKDTGRPCEKSPRTDNKQIHLHVVLFLFVGSCLTYPLRQGNGQGQTFKWVISHWTLKKTGILDDYPSCAPTLTSKKTALSALQWSG